MNQDRGFTVIEVLVSISIIAIVFAIVAPVFQAARESALIASAVSFMHQIGRAISIYRSDWETGGGYGTRLEAGLPPYQYVHRTSLGLSSGELESPCGYRPGIGWDNARHAPDYVWIYFPPNPLADEALQKYQENTLLVLDPWCNPSGTQWNNPYLDKRAIGLLLSGRVINRRKPGIADRQEWWASPSP